MTARFSRRIESFVCLNCGTRVNGNGYTNHCPSCLYSRHVDLNPGDRLSECKGLMEPVGFEQSNGRAFVLHRCVRCGIVKRNRTARGDSGDLVVTLSTTGVASSKT